MEWEDLSSTDCRRRSNPRISSHHPGRGWSWLATPHLARASAQSWESLWSSWRLGLWGLQPWQKEVHHKCLESSLFIHFPAEVRTFYSQPVLKREQSGSLMQVYFNHLHRVAVRAWRKYLRTVADWTEKTFALHVQAISIRFWLCPCHRIAVCAVISFWV